MAHRRHLPCPMCCSSQKKPLGHRGKHSGSIHHVAIAKEFAALHGYQSDSGNFRATCYSSSCKGRTLLLKARQMANVENHGANVVSQLSSDLGSTHEGVANKIREIISFLVHEGFELPNPPNFHEDKCLLCAVVNHSFGCTTKVPRRGHRGHHVGNDLQILIVLASIWILKRFDETFTPQKVRDMVRVYAKKCSLKTTLKATQRSESLQIFPSLPCMNLHHISEAKDALIRFAL